MSPKPKNVLVIGVDQAIPNLLERFMGENTLPNISNLVNKGVYTEAFSCPPCDTPTNWTTIATGATTAVHGATSFYLHIPGEPFEVAMETRSRSSLSRHCSAEYFWDVADRHGLNPFVINYPGGWPSNFKNGAMSLLTWPLPDSLPRTISFPITRTHSKESSNPALRIITTKESIGSIESKSPLLEISIEVKQQVFIESSILKAFIIDSEGKGYDSVAVPKDSNEEWQLLKLEEWSDWISIDANTTHGKLPCLFRMKFLELANDGSLLKIQLTNFFNTKGWTKPDDLGAKLVKNAIIYEKAKEQKVDYMISGKVKSYLLNSRKEALTLANSIKYMKDTLNWHVCFFHIHLLDAVNHRALALIHEDSPLYVEKKAEKTFEHVKTAYQIVDELVELLMKSCVDEETIVVFLSDHGAIPSWRIVNVPAALLNAGLLSYKKDEAQKKYLVDWNKTSAFPYLEPPYVWVNLKGRDPNGIVTPAEYDAVREDIIRALYKMRDPDNGKQIVKLALKKEEAAFLGQNGERVGDVVYYLHSPYSLFDGALEQLNAAEQPINLLEKPEAYMTEVNYAAHAYYLPTEKVGEYSVSVPLIFHGPSVQKGLELKRHVNLIDVAPTLSHLLQIPRPKDSEGRILHEIIK
jgi:predicted AlkP superfamily phosphohydrolase/phosphomutase